MNYTPRRELVAAEVRAELARQRRTPAELANGIGMSRATLSRRLAGQYPFTLDELDRVATWLGLAPESLLGRARSDDVAPEAVLTPGEVAP